MTAVRTLDLRASPDADLTDVVAHLRTGGVLAYPTETVYGLGGACDDESVANLRRVKPRDGAKPFIVLVPSIEHVEGLRWNDAARELASIFWPGSLTLVLPDPDHTLPAGVRSAVGAVAVRCSPHPLVRRLLDSFGAPITSTSLNAPGQEPARSSDEARKALRSLDSDRVMLLDAGTLPASEASTVLDCTSDIPVVLREGAVPAGRLRCAIPEIHG